MYSDLRNTFFETLTAQLGLYGWAPSDKRPQRIAPEQGRYWLDTGDTFVPVCNVYLDEWPDPDRTPREALVDTLAIVGVSVGATCPAGERLVQQLGGRFPDLSYSREVGELANSEELCIPIASQSDLNPQVAEAVSVICRHAVPFAKGVSTADHFIRASITEPDDDHHLGELVPAVRLACGDEAHGLRAIETFREKYGTQEYERFAAAMRHFAHSHQAISCTFPEAAKRTEFHDHYEIPAPGGSLGVFTEPNMTTGRRLASPEMRPVSVGVLGRAISTGIANRLPITRRGWHRVETDDCVQPILAAAYAHAGIRVLGAAFLGATVSQGTSAGSDPGPQVLIGSNPVGPVPFAVNPATTQLRARITKRALKRARYKLDVTEFTDESEA